MMSTLLSNAFRKNIFTKIGYIFARKGIKEMKSVMDYKQYGGAMLLGVNGAVVKGRGYLANAAAIFHNGLVAHIGCT